MRRYYELIKPGIVYGNTLTTLAGYLFALHISHSSILWQTVAALLFGLAAVMGGACVLNNIIDRDIDTRMTRTKERAIPTGAISIRNAFWFGVLLLVFGFVLLSAFVSLLAFLIALVGAVIYVGVYTPAKRFTPQSTIIGALAGAVPPVVGYAAVTGVLDSYALVLFLILVTWQMAHFFSIALYRMEEYGAAGLPVMPLVVGTARTKMLMFFYIVSFSYAVYALYALGAPGKWYAVIMLPACLLWFALSVFGLFTKDTRHWARRMFFVSLVVLLCASFAIAFS